jgi:hypothetical protein
VGLGDGLGEIVPKPLPPPTPWPQPPEPPADLPSGPTGLRTELFADSHLHHCVKVRYDNNVHFRWGKSSPDPLLPPSLYSIRWTGWLKAPQPGRYKLGVMSMRGATRLWLDDRLCIDSGNYRFAADLTDRPHAIRLEYRNLHSEGRIQLNWSREGHFDEHVIPPACLFHDFATAERTITFDSR